MNSPRAVPRPREPREHGAAQRLDRLPLLDPVLWWIVLAGVVLRASTIVQRGLWIDEAQTIDQIIGTAWETILGQVGNVHPPLFHLLMHFWVSVFGLSELGLRSFGMFFGTLSIFAAYWTGTVMFDRKTARIAAGLVAFMPYQVWYSQEARMYSMMMFFGVLTLGLLVRALERGGFGRWFLFGLATTAGLFSHYFFAFLVIGEVLFYTFVEAIGRVARLKRAGELRFSWSRPWRIFSDVPTFLPWFFTNLVSAACLFSWMTFAVFLLPMARNPLLKSVSTSGLGYGQSTPSFAIRFNDIGLMIVQWVFGFHPSSGMYAMVAMWPLLVYVGLLMLDVVKPPSRWAKLLLYSLSGIALIWLLGLWQGQVLASRYFMALSAPFVLLLARAAVGMPSHTRRAVLTGAAVLAIGLWANQSFNVNNSMRYTYREAVGHIAENFEPNDVVVYEPFYTAAAVKYYLPQGIGVYGMPLHGAFGEVRREKVQIGQDLARVTLGADRVWVVLSFQNVEMLRGDAYHTRMWLLRNGYRQEETVPLGNVELLRFDLVGRDGGPQ